MYRAEGVGLKGLAIVVALGAAPAFAANGSPVIKAVKAGDTLVLVESMKMELPVTAPMDGVVTQLRCAEGRAVLVAQTLAILRPDDDRTAA